MPLSERIEERLKQEKRASMSARIEEMLSGVKKEVTEDIAGGELGPPGMKSALDRLSIASANTLKEKVDAFTNRHPEGELIRVPGTGELLFRNDPSQPFSKVEGPGFEPLLDIIDFVGEDLGSILGEVATTVGTRGANLLPIMARLFGGSFGGEMLQQGVQGIQGIQEEPLETMLTRAGAKGTVSAVAGSAGGLMTMPFDVITGRGSVGLKPEAGEAISTAKELGIPGMTPGQVTDNPLLRKLEGQAGATIPTLERYYAEQNKAALSVFNRLRSDKEYASSLRGELTNTHEKISNKILSQAKASVNLTSGGKALQQGIKDYDETARFIVNDAYTKARDIESPKFDLTNLKKDANEIGFGIKGMTEAGEEMQLSPLSKELSGVVQNIRNIDPSIPEVISPDGGVITPTDQLRAIRSRLWDLKTPPPGEIMRQEHYQAARLYASITDALKNPKNSNASFVKAWDMANGLASKRFDTMEKLIVTKSAKSETPAQLADKLAQPNQIDNIRLLRSIVHKEKFDEFQKSFQTKLLRNSDSITNTLKSFDKETLDVLMSQADQKLFKNIGRQIDNLNDIGIKKIIDRQTNIGSMVKELLFRNDTASIDKLSEIVRKSGGNQGNLGRAIRGGLIEDIYRSSTKRVDGNLIIDNNLLSKQLERMNDSGLDKFLLKEDYDVLGKLDKVIPFIAQKADTGTSIQAAEAASGFRGVLTGDVSGDAIRTILEHIGIGRLLTSNFGRTVLIGSGKEKFSKQPLALTAAILGTASIPESDLDKLEKAISEKVK